MLSVEYRNDLYYGKYRYKATVTVKGVVYTHFCKTYNFFVSKMMRYQELQPDSIMRIWYSQDQTGAIQSEVIDFNQIEKYFDFLEENKHIDFTKNRATHGVSFFSNDLDFMKRLSIFTENLEIKECVPGDKEKMYFTNVPKFKYRTYFKPDLPLPKDFDKSVMHILENYKNGVGMSWSLIKFAFNPTEQGHHDYSWNTFIEYDDIKMQTVFHLTFGDILGKTYICEQKPKI